MIFFIFFITLTGFGVLGFFTLGDLRFFFFVIFSISFFGKFFIQVFFVVRNFVGV